MKRTGFAILFLIVLQACNKNSGSDKDTVPPIVVINTPVSAQVFTAGQPIQITGTITDDKYIAEVHIHVSNTNTGALLMDVHLYPASASTAFNQSIIAASGVNYKIQVIAKDRGVNETWSSVEVSCN